MLMRAKSSITNAYLQQQIQKYIAILENESDITIERAPSTIGNDILGSLDGITDISIAKQQFNKHHQLVPKSSKLVIDTNLGTISMPHSPHLRTIKKTMRYIVRHHRAYVMLTLSTPHRVIRCFYPRYGFIKTGFTIDITKKQMETEA